MKPFLAVLAVGLAACSGNPTEAGPGASPGSPSPGSPSPAAMPSAANPDPQASPDRPAATQVATFGAGCFWCVEAVLEQLDGVLDVRAGYMGGDVKNPTYEAVCTGTTGHAEVVQVEYDPSKIAYGKLLDWFFKLHDPTTLNRQGPDRGTQYRSAIFWHDEEQRRAAEAKKRELDESGAFPAPIVTEITMAGPFYEAESYHQDYYRFNKNKNPYCQVMITPKLDKLGLQK